MRPVGRTASPRHPGRARSRLLESSLELEPGSGGAERARPGVAVKGRAGVRKPPRAGGRDCARPASPRSWRVPSPPEGAGARDGALGARGKRAERGAGERGARKPRGSRCCSPGGEERETNGGEGLGAAITGPDAAKAIGEGLETEF